MQRIAFLLPFFFLIITCSPKLKRQFVTEIGPSEEAQVPEAYANDARNPCRNKLNYIPDSSQLEFFEEKILRLNFHIMCKEDSTWNFNHDEARKWLSSIMRAANEALKENKKSRLPVGNDYPVLDSKLRLKLTGLPNDPNDDGIYHHYDDDLFFMLAHGPDKNHHKKDVFEKYAVQSDSVMNVFIMSVHPDSVYSKNYRPYGRGIAFGNWLKVGAWHWGAQKKKNKEGKLKPKRPYWEAFREFNHEIMHNLGLRHSWRYNDGCADTPKHPNCWNKSSEPPCDSLWGNNIMDYNAFQAAITPCQIGTIHYNLSKLNHKVRKQLVPTWCTFNKDKSVIIKDTVAWNYAKDLEGHLIVSENAMLILRCRTSMPPNSRIIVAPGGHLILDGAELHNDCGKTWEGIEIQSLGKRKGKVELLGGATIANTLNTPKLLTEETKD